MESHYRQSVVEDLELAETPDQRLAVCNDYLQQYPTDEQFQYVSGTSLCELAFSSGEVDLKQLQKGVQVLETIITQQESGVLPSPGADSLLPSVHLCLGYANLILGEEMEKKIKRAQEIEDNQEVKNTDVLEEEQWNCLQRAAAHFDDAQYDIYANKAGEFVDVQDSPHVDEAKKMLLLAKTWALYADLSGEDQTAAKIAAIHFATEHPFEEEYAHLLAENLEQRIENKMAVINTTGGDKTPQPLAILKSELLTKSTDWYQVNFLLACRYAARGEWELALSAGGYAYEQIQRLVPVLEMVTSEKTHSIVVESEDLPIQEMVSSKDMEEIVIESEEQEGGIVVSASGSLVEKKGDSLELKKNDSHYPGMPSCQISFGTKEKKERTWEGQFSPKKLSSCIIPLENGTFLHAIYAEQKQLTHFLPSGLVGDVAFPQVQHVHSPQETLAIYHHHRETLVRNKQQLESLLVEGYKQIVAKLKGVQGQTDYAQLFLKEKEPSKNSERKAILHSLEATRYCFSRILALSPQDPDSHLFLGHWAFIYGKHGGEQAKYHYERYLHPDGDLSQVRTAALKTMSSSGDLAAYLAVLGAAQKLAIMQQKDDKVQRKDDQARELTERIKGFNILASTHPNSELSDTVWHVINSNMVWHRTKAEQQETGGMPSTSKQRIKIFGYDPKQIIKDNPFFHHLLIMCNPFTRRKKP